MQGGAGSDTGGRWPRPEKAALAIAHKILVAAFRILQRAVAFADLGAEYLDRVEASHRQAPGLPLVAFGYAVMPRPKPVN